MAEDLMGRLERDSVPQLAAEKAKHKHEEKENQKPPKQPPAPRPPLPKETHRKAAAATAEETKKDRSKQIASKRRQILQYTQCFPQHEFGKLGPLPASATEADCDIRLGEIREVLSTAQATETFVTLFKQTLKLQETVTMDWGYNPAGWNLRGLSQAVDDPSILSEFQPELMEGAIELSPYLATPWYCRLAFKIAKFNQTYSMVQNNPKLTETPNKSDLDDLEQLGAQPK